MENSNYRRKHLRVTSLHQEIKQEFVDWVRGLRAIKQTSKDQGRDDQRRELTAQESNPRQTQNGESDDERPWQNDGGESAEVV
jgi:hypothetical protein